MKGEKKMTASKPVLDQVNDIVSTPTNAVLIYPSLASGYFAPRYGTHCRRSLVVRAQLVACALWLGFTCQPVPAQQTPVLPNRVEWPSGTGQRWSQERESKILEKQ